jgi:citrate synthase
MKAGLDDVIAADTVLSHVDGEAGRLIVSGFDLEDLVERFGFEDATGLLWRAFHDGRNLRTETGLARLEAHRLFAAMSAPWARMTTVEAMRCLLSGIADGVRDREPVLMLAAAGTAAAHACRLVSGQPVIEPDPARSHAEDVLRMLRGRDGDPAEVRAFETYLVTVIDHGFNASTFAARVVASTAAGLPSAVLAGLCALKGPLHGGAPGPVLDMFDEIGEPSRADAWISAALQRGERLMGFGHRVYRVRDPRANVLKAVVQKLKGRENRIAFAEQVEAAALRALKGFKSERRLDTNVEFYTALLLEALDIPRAAFTPVFATGRTAGWIAHVREQEATGRLIRPQSRYVGPMPGRAA